VFHGLRGIPGWQAASVMGLAQLRRFDVVLATHGWWPWLLLYAFILILVAVGIRYILKRRKAV
jgi:hypothetical protein